MDENIIENKDFWSTRMDLDIVDYLDRIKTVFRERDHYKKLAEQLEQENEMLRHNLTSAFKGSQSIHEGWVKALLDGDLVVNYKKKQ